MKLVSTKLLLENALKREYAVAAFNVNNMEYIQAILESADELHSPVIISAAPSEIEYMGYRNFVEMVKNIGEDKNIPVAIHLDHGTSFEQAMKCIRNGFTSVMVDGSMLKYEDNVALTKKVVEVAHSVGVTVEGELGKISRAADINSQDDIIAYLTDPEEAIDFVNKTGVDCLAVSIGTAHGIYKFEPKLDFDRLSRISSLIKIPIVLHGGTGLPEESIKKAIKLGVAKINFSTAVRTAYISELRNILNQYPDELNLMVILNKGKEKMKETIKEMIYMCNSNGKAF